MWYCVSAAAALPRSCRSSSDSPNPPRRQLASSSPSSSGSEPEPSRRALEPLEHLVHHDPEPLVDRRLLRDPEHARELVLQRARPVGVDVGRGQHDSVTAHRQERLDRRVVARRHRLRPAPRIALGVEQIVVQRRRREDLALLGGHRLQDPRVHVAHRPRPATGPRAARSAPRASTAPGTARPRARRPGRCPAAARRAARRRASCLPGPRRAAAGRSSGASRRDRTSPPPGPPRPRPARRRASLHHRRRGERRAPVVRRRIGQHHAAARPRHRDVQRLGARPAPAAPLADRRAGEPPRHERDRFRRAGAGQPGVEPEHVHVLGLERRRRRRAPRPEPPTAASRSGSSCSRSPKSATAAMCRANSRGVACGARRA